ncbi:hypothetical protein KP509_39G009600 [Ceratopteris richardii]|nr:hypothetical protein KP509_39G009600 [Ceratopteris richardii]
MLQGVEQLADAVKVTMGPKGRNVLIEQRSGSPKVTKDGVTVAKSIEFGDKLKNLGASLVKQVANATNDAAGDGTTCATVLARSIYTEGCKAIAAGINVMDLRKGINMAVDSVVIYLQGRARMIRTAEEVAQVGTISANGDEEIGALIAKAMEKVGKDGVITVAEGKIFQNELEVVEGMKLENRGFISPYFITNMKAQKCELENPLILIHEKKISGMDSIIPILELIIKERRNLLIVADDVENEALATLVVNKLRGNLKICAIKAPGFGENRKANLLDLAILTGGQVISDDFGLTLKKVTTDMLGQAKKVTVSRDDTIILNGAGDKQAIEERCEQIREMMHTSSNFDKVKAHERLAKLKGGVAVLKVGGASDLEVSEKKDRVTDALNATRAAVDQGILPGGGVALLYASKCLDELKPDNLDQKTGIQVIQNALKAPTYTIATNAGVEGAVVVAKLLEQDNPDFGYDAATGEYVDTMKAGIIDPLKVIKTALVDAASVASLLSTTEAAVIELTKEEKASTRSLGGTGMSAGLDY